MNLLKNRLPALLKSKRLRIAAGVLIPLLGAALAVYLYFMKGRVPCVFYELTGIYCFGCGTSRAMRAVLHLDFLQALRFNIFAVLLLPVMAYFVLKYYFFYVFGKDVLPFPTKLNRKLGAVIIIVLFLFIVLRNIPYYPFTLLAPPE